MTVPTTDKTTFRSLAHDGKEEKIGPQRAAVPAAAEPVAALLLAALPAARLVVPLAIAPVAILSLFV